MNDRDNGIREIVRLLIGLLLGGGLAGGAMNMLGDATGNFWPGLSVLVFCVLAAVGLFVYGEWVIDRRRQRDLRRLGAAYVQLLNTTGQRLVDRLATVATENPLRPGELRSFVLETLGQLLSQTRAGVGETEEWERVFRESTETTVNEWRSLAAAEEREGFFPSGAEPNRI